MGLKDVDMDDIVDIYDIDAYNLSEFYFVKIAKAVLWTTGLDWSDYSCATLGRVLGTLSVAFNFTPKEA